jgi:hypothetical protein
VIGGTGITSPLLQVDQPASSPACTASFDEVRPRRRAQPRREVALVIPEGDPLGHLPSAEIFASSRRATGLTM